eukprot:TRINITY_DN13116_c0_g1_i1.p1 TRINITY_DN13116_c0_g1~~TRINITY_DN13116_c0_g1_i1.p1  ORF type:complete len:439 (+),score=125.77 TRINITY_DN13116_c0_g1_i1:74-1318(+)
MGGGASAAGKELPPATDAEKKELKGLHGVADKLKLPDPHLLLGATVDATWKFADMVEFDDARFSRAKCFEFFEQERNDELKALEAPEASKAFASVEEFEKRKKKLQQKREDWITEAFGDKLMGYDFCMAIRRWFKQEEARLKKESKDGKVKSKVCFPWTSPDKPEEVSPTDLSGAEYLLLQFQDKSGVGPATVFVSHVQSETIEQTLRWIQGGQSGAMEKLNEHLFGIADPSGIKLWLDYLVLRQCQDDFEPLYVTLVIQHIGRTLVVEDDVEEKKGGKPQGYLTRFFCIFEVASTPDKCLKFPLNKRRMEKLKEMYKGDLQEEAKDVQMLQKKLAMMKGSKVKDLGDKVDSKSAESSNPKAQEKIVEFMRKTHGSNPFKKVDDHVLHAIGNAMSESKDLAIEQIKEEGSCSIM